jgi:hypothetical protein
MAIAANGNRDLMSRWNAAAIGCLSKYWTQRRERCHYGNGKDHGPAQGGPPFPTRRYMVILLTSETPPLYALSLGHFELAALCEFLGRTNGRKALASTRRCQGFSAGATKTSACVGARPWALASSACEASKPYLMGGGCILTSIKKANRLT